MMKHIVCWKFQESAAGHSKEENLREAKRRLDALPAVIPEIRTFEVGIDEGRTDLSNDMVLVSTFDDAEALKRYQVHPEHVKVAEYLRTVHRGRVVVDYTI